MSNCPLLALKPVKLSIHMATIKPTVPHTRTGG